MERTQRRRMKKKVVLRAIVKIGIAMCEASLCLATYHDNPLYIKNLIQSNEEIEVGRHDHVIQNTTSLCGTRQKEGSDV